MAEPKMSALPFISQSPLPGNEEPLAVYQSAMQKLSDALERRVNEPSTNLWEVAGAFLAPTRTGSFFENLGMASNVLGQQQRRAEERELPIAQMRASLAGMRYQAEQDATAQKMLSAALGDSSTQDIAQMLSSPQGAVSNPGLMAKLFQLQATLPADSKQAEKVKQLIETQAKMLDFGIKSGDLNLKTIGEYNKAMESYYKTGVMPVLPTIGGQGVVQSGQPGQPKEGQPSLNLGVLGEGTWTVTSGAGKRTVNGMPDDHGLGLDVGGVKAGTVANSPVSGTVVGVGNEKNLGNFVKIQTPDGNIVTASHWGSVNVNEGDEVVAGETPIGSVGMTGRATGPHIHFQAVDKNGKPINPAGFFGAWQKTAEARTPLSPEKQQEVEKKRQEMQLESQKEAASKRGEPFAKKYDFIAGYDTDKVAQTDLKNRELMQLLKDHPDVAGLLVHQGPIYALLQAAETGIQTPFGQLSAPVTEALTKLQLSPEKQAIARNVLQIMSDLNQDIMRGGKDIYGPQISAFDAQEMAKPGFKNTDPVSFSMYLASKNIIRNKFMGELYEAQTRFFEENETAKTSAFFRSPEYKDIIGRYHATMNDLVKNSPFRKK